MGPNHYELRDSGTGCSVCGERGSNEKATAWMAWAALWEQ